MPHLTKAENRAKVSANEERRAARRCGWCGERSLLVDSYENEHRDNH
jgi:hypothetical protein